MTLVVRARTDPSALAASVRQAVKAVDPEVPVYAVRTLAEIVSDRTAQRRLAVMLITVFAAVALLLAAVGIYGVMSYAVAQRTQEIGIRMALGAERRDILRMVLRHGSLMAVTGIGLGLAVALGLARLITSLLFQVSATDPPTFSVVPVRADRGGPARVLHPGPARDARRSAGRAALPVGLAGARPTGRWAGCSRG